LACGVVPPVRTVKRLAELVGVPPRTLERQWRTAATGRVAWRLEDVLDWLLLLEAAFRKEDARGWGAVAAELGVHERTLVRLGMRLAGAGLGEVRARRAVLARRFAERLACSWVAP